MDILEIKQKAIKLRHSLKKHNIRASLILLFGSHAKGTANQQSDIDLAVVSADLGLNRLEEGALLNRLASRIDHRIEVVPIPMKRYFEKETTSPIIDQIIKTGIVIL
ncbi:MAG: nucleotidyltransferase domain-containing protein [Oligoflexia bacterium]|nr:nucleotidyltransferase domain-containing protein [Oligoflexia bacterium]